MKRKRRLLAIAASCMLLLSGCRQTDVIAKGVASLIGESLKWRYWDVDTSSASASSYDYAEEQYTEPPTEATVDQSRRISAALEQAKDAFGSDYDYEAAIRVLQESGLTGDEIDQEIKKYQEYAPTLLKTFDPIKQSQYIDVGVSDSDIYTDVNGNIYDRQAVIAPSSQAYRFAESESDGYVIYYLYGTYRNFDATLYRTYSSLSASENDWKRGTTVKIYGDDVLLYEGPQITKGTYEQYQIHLDVSGVRELKIVLLGIWCGSSSYKFYEPLIALANATIQK